MSGNNVFLLIGGGYIHMYMYRWGKINIYIWQMKGLAGDSASPNNFLNEPAFHRFSSNSILAINSG